MKIQTDKIKHLAVCFIVSAAAAVIESAFGASYPLSFLAGMIAGVAIGVGKEYGDKCAIGNRWDWNDILADAIGALLGSGVGALVSMV
ncbi:MAG: hypothetical protein K1W01_04745 [Muribaculaceae bacterium]